MRTDIPTIPANDLIADETPRLIAMRAARNCFELFADVDRWPEWVPGLRDVRTMVRTVRDRACEVLLSADLGGQRVGGRIGMAVHERALSIGFRSPPDMRLQLSGAVQFRPIDEQSCIIMYRVDMHGHDARVLPDALMGAFLRFVQHTVPPLAEGSGPQPRPRIMTTDDLTEVFRPGALPPRGTDLA